MGVKFEHVHNLVEKIEFPSVQTSTFCGKGGSPARSALLVFANKNLRLLCLMLIFESSQVK